MPDCVFCKIASGEIVSPRVYENGHVFVIDDINPVSSVHALIIAKKHISDIMAAGSESPELYEGIFDAVRETAKAKGVSEAGFRLITNCGEDGGQTVPHLHFHLIGGRRLGAKLV